MAIFSAISAGLPSWMASSLPISSSLSMTLCGVEPLSSATGAMAATCMATSLAVSPKPVLLMPTRLATLLPGWL